MRRDEFVRRIPKAELHIHLEGTLEPEMMFRLAKRNGVRLRLKSVAEVRRAYRFRNLQEFLDIYYEGAKVLIRERDFYELAFAYLEKAHGQGVLHAEMFFDPQTHTERGVPFSEVIGGINRARAKAEDELGMTSALILCFLRHLPESSALSTLDDALPYKRSIRAVGLDSSEKGNAPSKFKKAFSRSRRMGFLTVAHAGEEGPSSYVEEAIHLLKAKRIDHGNHAMDDERLVRYLARKKIPLTLCPLSNLKLGVIKRMDAHPLKRMMESGLLVTVNSDDPAYFGGYIAENYLAASEALRLNEGDIVQLARNSFDASFISSSRRKECISELSRFVRSTKRRK
jgi:adenine deaminase